MRIPLEYWGMAIDDVVDEQTKYQQSKADATAQKVAESSTPIKTVSSNKEAQAAYESIIKQGGSEADALSSARYAGQASEFFKANPELDPLTGQKKTTQEPAAEDDTQPDANAGAGGNANAGGGTNFDANAAALSAVNAEIAALTAQIASMQASAAAEAAKPKVVGQKTVRKTGGKVEVVQIMSDGTTGNVIDSYIDMGAKDSVLKMFENTGLGQTFITSLSDAIDKVYEENIAPTDAQVLNSIYSSDAYKQRFAANEAIRKRMADGKGRPGDRMLTPYEYIQTENSYREILQEAGLPTGFYDTQEDFTKFIENGISTAELTDRVNIAKKALTNADQQIVKSLQDYYGLSTGDLTAYLLDKEKAFNVIDSRFKYTTEEAKKMYTTAEIGGAALRAGGMADRQFAEEIYGAGKAGQAEAAFQSAATQQKDYQRLLQLSGQTGTQQDLAREELALAGGTDVTMRKKKLASAERAKFQQKSAIEATSLGRRTKSADV